MSRIGVVNNLPAFIDSSDGSWVLILNGSASKAARDCLSLTSLKTSGMVTIFSALRIKLSNPLPLMIAFFFLYHHHWRRLDRLCLGNRCPRHSCTSLLSRGKVSELENKWYHICMHIQNVVLVLNYLTPLAFWPHSTNTQHSSSPFIFSEITRLLLILNSYTQTQYTNLLKNWSRAHEMT